MIKDINGIFEIGEIVYYNLPDGDIGRVVDKIYYYSTGIIWYHVVFNPSDGIISCRDYELSRTKVII